MEQFRGTTILAVRKNGQVALGGDGQVSLGTPLSNPMLKKYADLSMNKYWPVLRAALPMPLLFLSDLSAN